MFLVRKSPANRLQIGGELIAALALTLYERSPSRGVIQAADKATQAQIFLDERTQFLPKPALSPIASTISVN
jgi:hypothetical protein